MSGRAICIADFEQHAKEVLPKSVYDYYRSGADEQQTLAENVAAFSRLKLYPRMLRDVSEVDLSTSILGQRVSMPICVGATAMQRMAHADGETATARGESDGYPTELTNLRQKAIRTFEVNNVTDLIVNNVEEEIMGQEVFNDPAQL